MVLVVVVVVVVGGGGGGVRGGEGNLILFATYFKLFVCFYVVSAIFTLFVCHFHCLFAYILLP